VTVPATGRSAGIALLCVLAASAVFAAPGPTDTPTPVASPTPPLDVAAFPNPYDPTLGLLTVAFAPMHAVTATVFTSAGEWVVEIPAVRIDEGNGVLRWDGRDAKGALAASGLYFVLVRGDVAKLSANVVLIR